MRSLSWHSLALPVPLLPLSGIPGIAKRLLSMSPLEANGSGFSCNLVRRVDLAIYTVPGSCRLKLSTLPAQETANSHMAPRCARSAVTVMVTPGTTHGLEELRRGHLHPRCPGGGSALRGYRGGSCVTD